MELRHLRYVLAVAKAGSIRAAARTLGVEASAVSRRIRDLEDEIGVALFNRSHSGVAITFAGRHFLSKARCAVVDIDHAIADLDRAGKGEIGIVRIGLVSSLAAGFLAELIESYESEQQGVHLSYVDGIADDHAAAIRRQLLDIAFVAGTPNFAGCDQTRLWIERIHVVMAESNSLAKYAEIRWLDLCGRDFVIGENHPGPEIQSYFLRQLGELGHRPAIIRQAVYLGTLMKIVASTSLLTLTNEAMTGVQFPGIVYRPIAEGSLPFCALWSPNNDNPACRRLLSLARAMSKRRLANQSETG